MLICSRIFSRQGCLQYGVAQVFLPRTQALSRDEMKPDFHTPTADGELILIPLSYMALRHLPTPVSLLYDFFHDDAKVVNRLGLDADTLK